MGGGDSPRSTVPLCLRSSTVRNPRNLFSGDIPAKNPIKKKRPRACPQSIRFNTFLFAGNAKATPEQRRFCHSFCGHADYGSYHYYGYASHGYNCSHRYASRVPISPCGGNTRCSAYHNCCSPSFFAHRPHPPTQVLQQQHVFYTTQRIAGGGPLGKPATNRPPRRLPRCARGRFAGAGLRPTSLAPHPACLRPRR